MISIAAKEQSEFMTDYEYNGTDDFGSKLAKYNHTIYSLDKQTFVYSKAKENYKDYFLQKWRHYAATKGASAADVNSYLFVPTYGYPGADNLFVSDSLRNPFTH